MLLEAKKKKIHRIHGAIRKTQEGAHFILIVQATREGFPQRMLFKMKLKRWKEIARCGVDERTRSVKAQRYICHI